MKRFIAVVLVLVISINSAHAFLVAAVLMPSPIGVALVVGKWIRQYTESQALTVAVNGRSMKQDEVDWDVIRFGAPYEDL
jgi:hypothetical protein